MIIDFNKYSMGGGGSGGGSGSDPEAVKYTAQSLTDAQKAQARTNIGAPSTDDLENMQAQELVPVTTLPTASADTMGKQYLVGPDANNEYARYVTSYDGTAYSWVPYGTTALDLSGYATDEELGQLEQKVNISPVVSKFGLSPTTGHAWAADASTQVGDAVADSTASLYQYYKSSAFEIQISEGAMLNIGVRRYRTIYHIIFLDADKKFLSGEALGTGTADSGLIYYNVIAPAGSSYLLVNSYSNLPACTITVNPELATKPDLDELTMGTERAFSLMGTTDPDAYLVPDTTNTNYYYNADTDTALGAVISADKNTTGAISCRYSVSPGDKLHISVKRYNPIYFVIFVDETMKFISGDFYKTGSGTDEYEGTVIAPTGAAFLLVNSYSDAGVVKNVYPIKCATEKDVSTIQIDAIYDTKILPLSKNAGRYDVFPNTVINSALSIVSGSTWVHDVFGVVPGDKYVVKYKTNAQKRYYVIFADADMKYVCATAYHTAEGVVTREVIIPTGVAYMIIQSIAAGSSDYGCTKVNSTETINRLMHPGIVEDNKDVEVTVNAASNYAKIDRAAKNFSMFVITDIHGDSVRFSRHCDYITRMAAIDAGICLGDMQSSNFFNDIDWYINSVNALTKPYLTVIGNHDAGNTNKTTSSATVAECYDKYIEPTLARIGDATIDKTYYSRLFPDYKIAVVVLNVFDGPDTMLDETTFAVSRTVECMSQAQVDWLVSTLQGIPSDYHLMLCYHFTDTFVDKVDCNFTDDFYQSYLAPINEAYRGLIGDIVGAWISGGSIVQNYAPSRDQAYLPTIEVNADFSSRGPGILVGHFIGHLHRDFVGKIRNHADQLVVGFGLGNIGGNYNNGDTPRLDGTKSQDLDTVVAVDTANKAINLVRVGANMTYKLVDRTYLRINYDTE